MDNDLLAPEFADLIERPPAEAPHIAEFGETPPAGSMETLARLILASLGGLPNQRPRDLIETFVGQIDAAMNTHINIVSPST